MSLQTAITTVLGAFMFPLIIRLFWGRLVNRVGAFGGFLAALIIVGTIWIFNHGVKQPFIYQSANGWIDMGWAAAIGVFTATALSGGKIKKSFKNIGAAVIGGILGGIALVAII